MKICLIRPAILVPAKNQTTMFTPPLGLAYIAGACQAAGHDVEVVDAVGESVDTCYPWQNDTYIYGLSPELTVNRIPEDVEAIGIQAGFSYEWPYTRDLINAIRERFQDVPLIAGGEHFTALPEDSLQGSALNMGVLGEGEETMVDLLATLERGGDLAEVPGIATIDDAGTVTINERRARKRAIDEFARPAWELLPIRTYLDRGFGFGVTRGRSMPVLASRGCPYQCTFCSNVNMWTTRWVARDPDELLDELQDYQDIYGAQNFDFYDLTAIVKKQWIVSFCTKIKERGMTFTWQLPSGTRSEAIDKEIAELLYQTGCRNLTYSPESGSMTTLEKVKKKIHPADMLKSMHACVTSGLNVKTNIMMGFPHETYREVWEDYKYIMQMAWYGAHDISVWGVSPYPGSELFEELRASGQLVMGDDYYDGLRSYADVSRTVSWSPAFSDERLRTLRQVGTALFYITAWTRRPWRPFKMVWNLIRGTHESRSEMALANILRRNRLKPKE